MVLQSVIKRTQVVPGAGQGGTGMLLARNWYHPVPWSVPPVLRMSSFEYRLYHLYPSGHGAPPQTALFRFARRSAVHQAEVTLAAARPAALRSGR